MKDWFTLEVSYYTSFGLRLHITELVTTTEKVKFKYFSRPGSAFPALFKIYLILKVFQKVPPFSASKPIIHKQNLHCFVLVILSFKNQSI